MAYENCPKCEKKLLPPFKSSGRQVCAGCGWSDKLKPTKSSKTSANLKSELNIPLPKFKRKILTISGCSIATLIVVVWGLASWSDTRVACSTKDGKPAYKVLKNIHTEWEDAVELASSTPRISLPPLISKLQKLKQKVEAQEWKECAEPAVNSLADSMKHTINALITFLDSDNSEWMYKYDVEKANEKMSQYSEAYTQLMPPKQRRIEEEKALVELEELTKEAREAEVRMILNSALLGQKTHFWENQEFTESTKAVYLDDYDNEHYDIKMTKSSNNGAIIIANVQQKEANLRSYSVAIAHQENSYEFETISCKTKEPSSTINPPTFSSSGWNCGAGSIVHE